MLAVVTNIPLSNSQAASAMVESASRIRKDLSVLEASLDQAIAAAATLAKSMIEARRDSGVPVHTGQQALIRLQRAQAHLVGASTDTFRVHDDLARIGQSLMMLDDPTPNSGLLNEDEPLRAVA